MPKEGRVSKFINQFRRVNEDASPEKLQEGELMKLVDMVLDNPYFVPSIRGGFEEWNANTITSNCGRMVDVMSPAITGSTSKNYLLGGYGGVIMKSQGGAWSNVITGMAQVSAEYGYFRHTAFADDIIITNGTGTPRRITGNSLETTTTVELAKPAVEDMYIQLIDTAVGNLDADSFYLWTIVYVTQVGERSNPSVPSTHINSLGDFNTTHGGAQQVMLSNIPVSSDDRVVSKWLFRTEGWDGSDPDSGKIFYLRAKLDADQTEFVDGLADEDLDFSETPIFSRHPDRADFVINSANRLWYANFGIHERSFQQHWMMCPPKGEDTIFESLNYVDSGTAPNEMFGIYSDQAYVATALLSDSGFDVGGDWTLGTGWSLGGSAITCDGSQTADSDVWQEIDPVYGVNGRLVTGRTYDVRIVISVVNAGTVKMVVGGTEGTARSSASTYDEEIVAGADGKLYIRADSSFDGTVTGILLGAGGLTAEDFHQWMVTYVDVNGFESEPTYGTVQQIGGTSPNLRWVQILPIDGGRIGANNVATHPDIKFARVYRTEGQATTFTPQSLPFYLVEEKDIRHDTEPTAFPTEYLFFDDLIDTRLGAVYAEVEKDAKSAITYSQTDRPAYILAENIRAIFRDDQDEITGILDDGNGILIFKENSIIKLYHTGASENWYIRKVWTAHGCDEPKSLIKAGSIIYFRYRKRMYSYVSGQAPQEIGYGKQTFLDTVDILNADATSDWIIWMTERIGASFPEWMLVWDRKLQAWYQFTLGNNFIFAVTVKKYETTSGWTGTWLKDEIFIIDLETYKYDKTSTVDDLTGSPVQIEPVIKFPRITLDDVTVSKLRDMVLNFQRVGSGAINLTLTTEAGAGTPTAIAGTSEGIQRISGFSTGRTEWYEIELTGYLQSVEALRVDVRPIRRGVGSV